MTKTTQHFNILEWIGLFLLIGFSIYAWKIPSVEIPVYKPICIVVFCIVVFYVFATKENRFIYSPLQVTYICWGLVLTWGIILIPFTFQLGVNMDSITYIMAFIAMAGVFSYYSIIDGGIQRLLLCYIILSGAIGILGWYEAITGNIINITPGSYYYKTNFLGLHYPNTIFYNINDNAVFMTMSLFIAWLYTYQLKHRVWIRIVALIVYGGNIVLVDSRGALLAMVAFFIIQTLETKNAKKILPLVLVLGVGLIAFSNVSLFAEGMKETGRSLIWENTINNIKSSSFLGVGAGNIVYANRLSLISPVADVHNFFLELLADYGFIGFFSVILWYCILLVICLKGNRLYPECRMIFNILICFLPLSIVSSSLIGKSWTICFFSILISYLNYIQYQAKKIGLVGKERCD